MLVSLKDEMEANVLPNKNMKQFVLQTTIFLSVFMLPSLVHSNTLDSYRNEFDKHQQPSELEPSSSSISQQALDTKNFLEDTVPAAFDWGNPTGVSRIRQHI